MGPARSIANKDTSPSEAGALKNLFLAARSLQTVVFQRQYDFSDIPGDFLWPVVNA